jgi:hypothetical protein
VRAQADASAARFCRGDWGGPGGDGGDGSGDAAAPPLPPRPPRRRIEHPPEAGAAAALRRALDVRVDAETTFVHMTNAATPHAELKCERHSSLNKIK